jgi:hypothetical protein
MPLTSEAPVTINDRSSVTAACYADQPTTQPPGIQHITLSAIAVDTLTG